MIKTFRLKTFEWPLMQGSFPLPVKSIEPITSERHIYLFVMKHFCLATYGGQLFNSFLVIETKS